MTESKWLCEFLDLVGIGPSDRGVRSAATGVNHREGHPCLGRMTSEVFDAA